MLSHSRQLQELGRHLQHMVGAPGFNRIVFAQVAPSNRHRLHTSRTTRHYVTAVIANVGAGGRRHAQSTRSFEQGCGMRFRVCRCIAADKRRCTRTETKYAHQRFSEPGCLVGDDGPRHASLIQCVKHRTDVFEQGRLRRHSGFVPLEKLVTNNLERRIIRCHIKCPSDHAPSARADQRSQRIEGQSVEPASKPHVVGCTRQVGRAIDQGTVQIKQDRLKSRALHSVADPDRAADRSMR